MNATLVAETLTAANIRARIWTADSGKVNDRVYVELADLDILPSKMRDLTRQGGAYVEIAGDEALVQGFDGRTTAAEARIIEALRAVGIDAR